MKTILDLFSGGSFSFAVVGAAIVAVLGFIGALLYKVKKSGIDQQKVKEADAHAKHLQEIQDAAAARPSGLPDDDPYNRDR
jgi:hypothetical protein